MFIYVKNQISNKIRQFLLTFLFFNQKKMPKFVCRMTKRQKILSTSKLKHN